MSATGRPRAAAMARRVSASIRVTVSVSNAGWLKSGHENPTPCAASSSLEPPRLRRRRRRREAVEIDDVGDRRHSIVRQSGRQRHRIVASPSVR